MSRRWNRRETRSLVRDPPFRQWGQREASRQLRRFRRGTRMAVVFAALFIIVVMPPGPSGPANALPAAQAVPGAPDTGAAATNPVGPGQSVQEAAGTLRGL